MKTAQVGDLTPQNTIATLTRVLKPSQVEANTIRTMANDGQQCAAIVDAILAIRHNTGA